MKLDRHVQISKYLSKHLRHAPERIGLQMDAAGWVEIEHLLRQCAKHNFRISREELCEVVENNAKQRFAFDDDEVYIRANQGHSIPIELGLKAQAPPDMLYHGTGAQTVETILREGLRPMRRHHVHLSSDVETARTVGARHGKPVVLEVDAKSLHESGTEFWASDNGVWLADQVPPSALRVLD